VVVTVLAVGVMQVTVHQVVDMITVRHRRMPAVRAMDMIRVVAVAFMFDASVGVGLRDRDDVLVVVVFMGAMKVPVVQIAHMVLVPDGDVTAVRAMRVGVIFVDLVGHDSNLLISGMYG
jgi:hypothetical protein